MEDSCCTMPWVAAVRRILKHFCIRIRCKHFILPANSNELKTKSKTFKQTRKWVSKLLIFGCALGVPPSDGIPPYVFWIRNGLAPFRWLPPLAFFWFRRGVAPFWCHPPLRFLVPLCFEPRISNSVRTSNLEPRNSNF